MFTYIRRNLCLHDLLFDFNSTQGIISYNHNILPFSKFFQEMFDSSIMLITRELAKWSAGASRFNVNYVMQSPENLPSGLQESVVSM